MLMYDVLEKLPFQTKQRNHLQVVLLCIHLYRYNCQWWQFVTNVYLLANLPFQSQKNLTQLISRILSGTTKIRSISTEKHGTSNLHPPSLSMSKCTVNNGFLVTRLSLFTAIKSVAYCKIENKLTNIIFTWQLIYKEILQKVTRINITVTPWGSPWKPFTQSLLNYFSQSLKI